MTQREINKFNAKHNAIIKYHSGKVVVTVIDGIVENWHTDAVYKPKDIIKIGNCSNYKYSELLGKWIIKNKRSS